MKRRHLACLLLAGCTGEIQTASQVPQVTESPIAEIDVENACQTLK